MMHVQKNTKSSVVVASKLHTFRLSLLSGIGANLLICRRGRVGQIM